MYDLNRHKLKVLPFAKWSPTHFVDMWMDLKEQCRWLKSLTELEPFTGMNGQISTKQD